MIPIICILLSLAACGDTSQTSTDSSPPSVPGGSSPSPADAEPAAWSPSKNVSLIIPFGPGGGYDAYGRAVAEEIQKRLPPGVRIDVKNVEGAGGNVGAETLKRAQPDGHTLGMVHNIQVALHKYQSPTATLDIANDFAWVAGITAEPYILFSGAQTGIDAFADLTARPEPLRMGSGGFGVPNIIGAILTQEFDIPVTHLTAYSGAGDNLTAVIRGDVETSVYEASSIYSFVESGEFVPLVILDEQPSALFPGVPVAGEVGLDGAIFLSMRPVALPKDTPAHIQEYWRQIFEAAVTDPELAAWSEQAKREVTYRGPAEVERAINGMVQFLESYEDVIIGVIETIGQ